MTTAVLSPMFASELLAAEDIYVTQKEWQIFVSVRNRLRRIKKFVGFGNFNIISFDQALLYARNYSVIGAFTKEEFSFIEKIFYEDPKQYGFYGERICSSLTQKISRKDVKKIPYTGHYLFKAKPLEDYLQLKKDIGSEIILTSGVRSVVKQMSLYMDKVYSCRGNITQASCSLAPPAYSYHSKCDFDVGKRGWGHKNFTAHFARTREFRALRKLNYIDMRYTINNRDGVRYEPWHVKIL
ncbi:MAG: M15 family metallopeptidase [Campylobacterota bacterium]|nr:M15 family metallopeptidase [Campylobacterota bacterium]